MKKKASETLKPKSKPKTLSNSSVFKETKDRNLMKTEARNEQKILELVNLLPKICDGLAIVKNSKDPYEDFCRSMLEMISHTKFYCADDSHLFFAAKFTRL